MKSKGLVILSLVFVLGLILGGCGPEASPDPGLGENDELKIAALFSAAVHDEDFNAIGFAALQEVGIYHDLPIAYSEKVAIPDTKRVIEEYIADGYNVIWAHSGLFNGAVNEICDQYPDVSFILEVDIVPEEEKPNIWNIKRNYHLGHYVIGAAAALSTKTDKIGFVGGAELPYIRGNVNAIQQAIDDLGSNAKIHYIQTGDFADVIKAKQATETLIAKGCDVIVSGTNIGNYGIFSAVLDAGKPVLVTTMYTHKEHHIPDNYLTTDLFDFSVVLKEIIGEVKAGKKGGFMELVYGKEQARYNHFPLLNVSEEINNQVQQIADDVESGKITVVENLEELNIKE